MLHALATSSSPEARRLLAACAGVADPDKLAVCLLAEQDAIWQMRRRAERRVRQELPALVTASLTPDLLTQAVQAWLPMVSSR
jgi:hypothetical protein